MELKGDIRLTSLLRVVILPFVRKPGNEL
jgi:hypothetical protein